MGACCSGPGTDVTESNIQIGAHSTPDGESTPLDFKRVSSKIEVKYLNDEKLGEGIKQTASYETNLD